MTNKTTAPSQSAASSSRQPSTSKKTDKGNQNIKQEEDRLNDILAQDKKGSARVIYWDLSELNDWPRTNDVGAMESHNVRAKGFHTQLLTRAPGRVCLRIC
jgi:hypothetical protein